MVNAIPVLFAPFGFIIPICGIYLGLDTYSMLENYLIPDRWRHVVKFVLIPFKLSLIGAGLFSARVFSLLISFPALASDFMFAAISSLSKRAGILKTSKATKYLVNYSSCQIILTIMSPFSAPCVATILFYSFILTILNNFISLKMYHVIPLPPFAYFPMSAVLIPTMVRIVVPMMISIHTDSTNLIDQWGHILVKTCDKKYIARLIKAQRRLQIYAGFAQHNCFSCVRSTLPTYFEAVLNYTITALMSIDASDFDVEM